MSTNQWALSVGVAVGPGIGGLVADTYGLDVPFFVVGGTAILTAIYGAIRLPETRDRAAEEAAAAAAGEGGDPPASTWSFVLSTRFLLIALITATIFMTRAGTRGTLVPLHADEALGWGPGEIGVVFTVTGVMTLFTLMPAAWGSDRLGRQWVIMFSGLCAGAGALLIGASSGVGLFVAGNIVMTLGTGTAGPAPAAYVADIAPPHLRGLSIALYRSAGDVGFLAAPPLLGLLSEAPSIGAAMVVSAMLVAGASVVFFAGSRGDPAAGRGVVR